MLTIPSSVQTLPLLTSFERNLRSICCFQLLMNYCTHHEGSLKPWRVTMIYKIISIRFYENTSGALGLKVITLEYILLFKWKHCYGIKLCHLYVSKKEAGLLNNSLVFTLKLHLMCNIFFIITGCEYIAFSLNQW